MNTSKIFLSYSNEDAEVADEFQQRLSDTEIALSFHTVSLRSPDSLKSALRSDISASDFLIVLLSPSALESTWVKYELETAVREEWRQRSIIVMVVKVKPCRVPDFLATNIMLDATKNREKAINQLVRLLENAPLIDFDKLPPQEFERFVGDLLRAYNFKNVSTASFSRDEGYDFTATYQTRDPFGRSYTYQWWVAVKAHRQKTDISALRAFLGAVKLHSESIQALFVTSSQVTSAAREWLDSLQMSGGPRLFILEGPDLRRLVLSRPKLFQKYFGKK